MLKIVYLMRLRRILGYPHGSRDEGLQDAHAQLVQQQRMPEGYSRFDAETETGFYTPAQIAKAVKSTEREWFGGRWGVHRVGWTRTFRCGLQIYYSSDVSPRRGWVHTDIILPQLLRLPLEPSSLFWIEGWKLVQCREPEAFSQRYGLLLRLVCLFADELDRLTSPAAGGGTGRTGDPAGVTDQRES